MFEVLRKFNLGEDFISLVKCCYKFVIFFLGPSKNKDIDILNTKIERSTINKLGVHTCRSVTVKET